MKRIDLKLTVAELVKAYPELIDILAELALEKILNPAALKAMGNIMTLPRGAGSISFHIRFHIRTICMSTASL